MGRVTAAPGRLDIATWPGRDETLRLAWPDGQLPPGDWAATTTLDGLEALPVSVDGDTVTVELLAVDVPPSLGAWQLTVDDRAVIAGTFRVSDQPGPSTIDAAVQLVEQTVQVTLVGGLDEAPVQSVQGQTGEVSLTAGDVGADPAGSAAAVADDLGAHEGTLAAGGAHGRIVHDFDRDGWDGFTPLMMTAHGGQEFEESVVAGRGRVTGLNPGDASHRIAYVRSGTRWADSEIRSVIWGPSPDWNGVNAQQGHLHRIVELEPGLWVGIAIWTSVVFGGDYRHLHVNAFQFNGTQQWQGTAPAAAGSSDSGFVDRQAHAVGRDRIQFGVGLNRIVYQPSHYLAHLEAGVDTVDVAGMGSGWNGTGMAISQLSPRRSQITVQSPETNTQSWAPAPWDSFVTPASRQRRWVPFVLATRVIGGTESEVPVEWMRWRLGEEAPDWGDPRVRRGVITPSGNVPVLPTGVGDCALWGAHFFAGSYGEFGAVEFQQA